MHDSIHPPCTSSVPRSARRYPTVFRVLSAALWMLGGCAADTSEAPIEVAGTETDEVSFGPDRELAQGGDLERPSRCAPGSCVTASVLDDGTLQLGEGASEEVSVTGGHFREAAQLPTAVEVLDGPLSPQDGPFLCVDGDDLVIDTPAGAISLLDAEVCTQRYPFALHGRAKVPFPGHGFLSAFVDEDGLQSPEMEVFFGPGELYGEVEVQGRPIELLAGATYFLASGSSGYSLQAGAFSLSTPSEQAQLVVGVDEHLYYLGGGLGIPVGAISIDGAALGFSLHGRLPIDSSAELWNGQEWFTQEGLGHVYAQGALGLPKLPFETRSPKPSQQSGSEGSEGEDGGGSGLEVEMLIDVDADDDGVTAFEGDSRDFVLTANAGLSFSSPLHELVDLSLHMGDASFVLDARSGVAGALYFAATQNDSPFEGTVLDFLDSAAPQQRLYGYFHDVSDFEVTYETRNAQLSAFPLTSTTVSVLADGAIMQGHLEPAGLSWLGEGGVDLRGEITDEHLVLRGEAGLTLQAFELAAAQVQLRADWGDEYPEVHASAAGRLALPGLGHGDLAGALGADGSFLLMGTGTIAPAGFQMAGTSLSLSPTGLSASGEVELPGLGSLDVSGAIEASGDFALTGRGELAPAGLKLADAVGRITPRGAHIRGTLELGHGLGSVVVEGEVGADGFELTGTGDLTPAGFKMAGATVRVTQGGAFIQGEVALQGVGAIEVSGWVGDRKLKLPFGGSITIPGFMLEGQGELAPAGLTMADARVTITTDGASIRGRVNYAGTGFDVSGRLQGTGFSLSGTVSAGGSAGPAKVKGTAPLTLENSGVSARFKGEACVEFLGCVDVSAGIDSGGRISVKLFGKRYKIRVL